MDEISTLVEEMFIGVSSATHSLFVIMTEYGYSNMFKILQASVNRPCLSRKKKGDQIMLGHLRRALLRLDYIKKAVADYNKKQWDDQLFAKCMIASGAIRDVKDPKIVSKGYIDSTNWGGTRL